MSHLCGGEWSESHFLRCAVGILHDADVSASGLLQFDSLQVVDALDFSACGKHVGDAGDDGEFHRGDIEREVLECVVAGARHASRCPRGFGIPC